MNEQTDRRLAGWMRIVVAVLALLSQIILIALLIDLLKNQAVYVYFAIEVLALLTVIILISQNPNSSFTITWLVIIMILPVFGFILFFLWGRGPVKGRFGRRVREMMERGFQFLEQGADTQAKLQADFPYRRKFSRYLSYHGFPVYHQTSSRYYPLGEAQFEAMLEDIEKAERFVFLEYFIFNEGHLWNRFEEVLVRKAKEGVEVRILFDDFGSIITAPDSLVDRMAKNRISVQRFNPIHKITARLYINYRNHQKIAVIDGNIAYTGGANMADEYANIYPKHGHWKDTAIRLEGDAVWSLTVTFLEMWDADNPNISDYEAYRPTKTVSGDGYYQPFTDGPLNNPDNPGEDIYRMIISNAQKYVYITTPYLVVDNKMVSVLQSAAESGVDVRIVTPKVYDKWYVHYVTQSNYGALLKAGVKIYEYTPGFMHAKMIISDDDHGVIGSFNLDYRSFHFHFENGVWLAGAPALKDMKQDILASMAHGEEIQYELWEQRPWYVKILQTILRLFSVLL